MDKLDFIKVKIFHASKHFVCVCVRFKVKIFCRQESDTTTHRKVKNVYKSYL